MNNKKAILVVIGLGIIIVGLVLILMAGGPSKSYAPQNNETTQTGTTMQNDTATQPTNYEVLYTDAGYFPAQVTVKVGDTVTFKNQSTKGMWTASAMHPSHTVYSGTSLQQHCPDPSNTAFDACTSIQPGQSWSFTFTKTGEWAYHNHVAGPHFGKIIVE